MESVIKPKDKTTVWPILGRHRPPFDQVFTFLTRFTRISGRTRRIGGSSRIYRLWRH